MPEESLSAVNRGLAAEILSLAGSLGRYFQALGLLAAAEGREAGENYLRMGILLGAAFVFAIFGYLLGLLFLAFLASGLLGISWLWISGGLALIHVVLAVLALAAARQRFQRPVFRTTAAELRKDFEALRRSPGSS